MRLLTQGSMLSRENNLRNNYLVKDEYNRNEKQLKARKLIPKSFNLVKNYLGKFSFCCAIVMFSAVFSDKPNFIMIFTECLFCSHFICHNHVGIFLVEFLCCILQHFVGFGSKTNDYLVGFCFCEGSKNVRVFSKFDTRKLFIVYTLF